MGDPIKAAFGKYGWNVFFSNLFGTLILVVICVIGWVTTPDLTARSRNAIAIILGALLGWFGAMFFSTYNRTERNRFSEISQTISVFLSGYAVSKIDRFLELSLFQTNASMQATGIQSEGWFRASLFAATLVLTFLVVFSNRVYFQPGERNRQVEKIPLD